MMLHAIDYLIWYGSGRISCKLLPKASQTAYEGTLGQKNKKGIRLICNSANKGSGSMLQKGSVYSCSIPLLPLQIDTSFFIPLEDGTYA